MNQIKRTCRDIKQYLKEEENLSYIALILYDILPLPIKLAVRYEKFRYKFITKAKKINQFVFRENDKQKKEIIINTVDNKQTEKKNLKRDVKKKTSIKTTTKPIAKKRVKAENKE